MQSLPDQASPGTAWLQPGPTFLFRIILQNTRDPNSAIPIKWRGSARLEPGGPRAQACSQRFPSALHRLIQKRFSDWMLSENLRTLQHRCLSNARAAVARHAGDKIVFAEQHALGVLLR